MAETRRHGHHFSAIRWPLDKAGLRLSGEFPIPPYDKCEALQPYARTETKIVLALGWSYGYLPPS